MSFEAIANVAKEVAKEAAKEASREAGRVAIDIDKRKSIESFSPKGEKGFVGDASGKRIDIDKRIDTNKTSEPSNSSSKDNPEKKITSNADIEKMQTNSIETAEKNPDLNKLESQAKGNYAEMKVDRDLASKGYDRISTECVTDLSTPTGPGIDGVFVNEQTGKTLITETKFNKSELGITQDGKQMSSKWIDNRLDAAVGKEKADMIRINSIINPDSVQSVLAKVDLNGNVSYFKLDAAANILGGIEL